METIESIREFWFGTSADDQLVADQQSHLWWAKDPTIDQALRQRFEPCLQMLARGKLDAWAATVAGRLALILLADQLPRNIYRDTPAAFSLDAHALSWCEQGLARGDHRLLRPIEKVFFYLPLEHSESLQNQDRSVSLFEALVSEVKPEQRALFDGFLQFAWRHREVVARYGRFPHRNHILGRESTPEERVFLTQKASSF